MRIPEHTRKALVYELDMDHHHGTLSEPNGMGMKYMRDISKTTPSPNKANHRVKSRFSGPRLSVDPDKELARKIQELAVKSITSNRQTTYVESAVKFPEEDHKNLIQWPPDQKILEVSKRLAQIKKMGIRSETHGDYFNSGDLAYQIQEIIRLTGELFQKSQRIKH